ncbi:protein kinase, partial [Streptomyces triticirhizae]|uniref:protein kinase n=1 Tax=Streptomyces triticirhizae TaxID=2483353 RepID=UPI002D77D307
MDKYAGRLLADRYRLPQTPSDEFEFVESRAFDTASGQEVLVRQVPLPEVVDAELVDGPGRHGGAAGAGRGAGADRATRTPDDPVVRRAVEAATAAAALPDHPRLDQVFDVFVQGDGLWIVSELVPARPLAALLAEERLGPYRAAEVAADLLAALRIVHAHGWTHRNVTARTVLICDDGRAVLTGLAAGAAEEVLCGYDPLPAPDIPDTFAAHPRKGISGPEPGPGSSGRVAMEKPAGWPPGGGGGAPGPGTAGVGGVPAPGPAGAGAGGWPGNDPAGVGRPDNVPRAGAGAPDEPTGAGGWPPAP